MARRYILRGTVQIVRCPFCHMFFITYAWARYTRCRFCEQAFSIHISPKAKKFHPPRNRSIALFWNYEDAIQALGKLNALAAQGSNITNEQAKRVVQEAMEERPGS
jgi:protein-arginine kinase activator protein McsA